MVVFLRVLILVGLCGLGPNARAAETELPIPLSRPGDAMRAYIRVTNPSDRAVEIGLHALDADGRTLAATTVTIPSAETASWALHDLFGAVPENQIARVKVDHPPQVTVQIAFGVRPPERPKAFSVPV
jgi:hypothetical protein